MNLNFANADEPLIKLRTMVALTSDYKPYNQRTFRFEGHVYMILSKTDSAHTTLTEIEGTDCAIENEAGFMTCVNLKSHTLRGISLDAMVEIVEVEASVKPLRWPGNAAVARNREDF